MIRRRKQESCHNHADGATAKNADICHAAKYPRVRREIEDACLMSLQRANGSQQGLKLPRIWPARLDRKRGLNPGIGSYPTLTPAKLAPQMSPP
jgi:hypothetical protein